MYFIKHKLSVLMMALLMIIVCIPAMVFAEASTQDIMVTNTPVKGMIQLEKRGPVLTGFDEHQDPFGNIVHTPLYAEGWLDGATFEIHAVEDIVGKDGNAWFKKDELVATVTTTTGKAADSPLLPLGHYYVIEVSAPEGYIFDSIRYDVVLAATDHETPVVKVSVQANNDYAPAKITLLKEKEVISTTKSDNDMYYSMLTNVAGEGFVFGLYNNDAISYPGGVLEANTLIATAVSDKDGKLSFNGSYPIGQYYVQEISAPEGWIVNNNRYSVTISDVFRTDEDIIVYAIDEPVHNEILHADLRIAKTDLTGSDYLADCLIEVTDSDGNIVCRAYTGDDGYLPEIHLVPGTYTYREVLAPEGYELCVTEFNFTVNDYGRVTEKVAVADDYTRFSIKKTDPFHEPMIGVEFGLFREDGTQIAAAVSDKNGLVTFEKIPYGTYYIQETKTLSSYLKNFTKVPITIDGTFVNPEEPIATLINCPTEILINKVDQNGTALAGAEFGLFDENGKLVMTAVSDADGNVLFTGAEYGKYTIRELSAPDGYLVSKDVIHVTIDDGYTNPEEPMATVVDHEKKIMYIKVDTSGNPMTGIEFALYNATTMELVETVVSDENGVFIFRNFDYGDWIIREMSAPEGYCVLEDIHLHVGDDWAEPNPIMCVNIPNHFEFIKTDSSGVPMSGVKFRLEDASGKDLGTYVSGKDGIVHINDLKRGVYYIKEIETLEGYRITGEVIKVTIDEYYTVPETMRKLINYTVFQTGVNLAVTGIMWVGLGLMLVSGTIGLIRKRRKNNAK